MDLINETATIKYQVKLGNQVLTESHSRPVVEQFITTLSEEQRQKAVIVPVTEAGQQVLFG
jgi:hypothetical protein